MTLTLQQARLANPPHASASTKSQPGSRWQPGLWPVLVVLDPLGNPVSGFGWLNLATLTNDTTAQ